MAQEIFSERLKLLREVFSVSQLRLAEAIRVKQYYIAKWESAAYIPNVQLKKQIADFFEVSPLWLEGENPHAFRGIVFVRRNFIFEKKRLDSASIRKMISFIRADGAVPRMSIINSEQRPDAIIVFQRDDELLLFFPYVSFDDAPSRFALEHEIHNLLYFEETGPYTVTYGTTVIFAEALERINPNSSIEEITEVLNFTIPERLQEIWALLSQKKRAIREPEWTFDVEITIRDNAGLSESDARESILGMKDMFNNLSDKKKVVSITLKG